MGYYCDVTLRCRKGVFERLQHIWKTTDFPKPSELTKLDGDYYIQWFSIKWRQYFLPNGKSPEDILNKTLSECSQYLAEPSDLSYSFCVIGEDIADIEYTSNTDSYSLDIVREVSIPLNGERVSIMDQCVCITLQLPLSRWQSSWEWQSFAIHV